MSFLDYSVVCDFELRWKSPWWQPSRRENLPLPGTWGLPWTKASRRSIEVRADRVWFVADCGVAMRKGDAHSTGNPWVVWQAVTPSDALFAYLEEEAKKGGDAVIALRKSYTVPKRTGRYTFSSAGQETLTALIYEAKAPDGQPYSAAPTSSNGYWGPDRLNRLPHKVRKIDFVDGTIYCTSPAEIPGMPRHLVFSPDPDYPAFWLFNRKKTEELNQSKSQPDRSNGEAGKR